MRGEDYKAEVRGYLARADRNHGRGRGRGAGLFLLDGERKELSLVKRSSNQVLLRALRPSSTFVSRAAGPSSRTSPNRVSSGRSIFGADSPASQRGGAVIARPVESRPRFTSHHGVVTARGFFISQQHLPKAELEHRVLELWESGVELYELGDGVVAIAPREFRAAVHGSPGAPLVEVHGILSTAPLSARDRERLERGTDLVVVEGGVARGFCRAELRRVDPADFLSVSGFEIQASRALTSSTRRPTSSRPSRRARHSTTFVQGEASSNEIEILELVEASRELRQGSKNAPSRGVLGALFEQLSALFSSRRKSASAPSGTRRDRAPSTSSALSVPPKVGPWQRLKLALRAPGRAHALDAPVHAQASQVPERAVRVLGAARRSGGPAPRDPARRRSERQVVSALAAPSSAERFRDFARRARRG